MIAVHGDGELPELVCGPLHVRHIFVAGLRIARIHEAGIPALPVGVYREMGSSRFLNIGRVFAVSYSPGGKTLAASCWDGTVWLGDVASGDILREWPGSRGWGHVHAFSPDGKVLAAAGGNQIGRLWDVASGKALRELKGHTGRPQWVG